MSSNQAVANLFNNLFDNASQVIEFQNSFNNGTGYFDPAVKLIPDLGSEVTARFVTPSGRKAVVIGTNRGNIVVFQRYDSDDTPIVWNATREVEMGLGVDHKHLDSASMELILLAGEKDFIWVGDETTCQFGNSSDTSGYEKNTKVVVVGIQFRFGPTYLVQKVGQEYYGCATLRGFQTDVYGVLYCTDARVVGKGVGGTWDRARCVESLGFKHY
jgi:hypothetical protein